MDKYQKYLLKEFNPKCEEFDCCTFDDCSDVLTIKQDEDIEITKYTVILCGIDSNESLVGVSVLQNGTWNQIDFSNGCPVKIVFDFCNRIDKVKLSFRNKIIDDYVFETNYIEADKDKYYAKKEEERQQNLLKATFVRVSTGVNLVNVFFAPCCEEYDHTEVTFYAAIPDNKGWSVMTKRVAKEDFYISLCGLAYGKYAFVLSQYDERGKIIVSTSGIEFAIVEHTCPDCGTLNVI